MEELAVIKDINIGCRDVGKCVCWFTVEAINGCSLQVISLNDLSEMVNKSGVYSFKELNGKPCVIESGNSIQVFKRLL